MMHARVMEPYRTQSVLFSVAKGDTYLCGSAPPYGSVAPALG